MNRRTPLASNARRVVLPESLERRVLLHAGEDHLGVVTAPLEGAESAIVRINAGGKDFTDAAGLTWSADAGFAGGKALRSKFAVAATTDDGLFSNRRTGAFAYTVPAADGAYTLSLGFVDTLNKPGKRLFNVDAEGQRIENSLDIVARSGGKRTALFTSYTVNVTGGALDLIFTGVKGKPVVSAISLTPALQQPTAPTPDGSTLPPAAPFALAAITQSSSEIALTWTDASNDETSFELQRSFSGHGFTSLTTLAPDTSAYTDTGLEPDRVYTYRVRAVSAAGASAWTVTTTSRTQAVPEPAPPPATAPNAPANLSAQIVNDVQVQLAWSDQSSDETGFYVERALNGAAFAKLTSLPADTITYVDTMTSIGNTYAYRVSAVSDAAGTSSASDPQSVTIQPPVTQPVPEPEPQPQPQPEPGPTPEPEPTPEPVPEPPPGPETRPIDTFTDISWSDRPAAPLGKAEALRAVVDNKLYVFAGFTSSGPVATSDVFDPAENAWAPIADMPRRLTHAGVAVEGRDVYFAGGYIGTGNGFDQQFGTAEVWKYNVDANAYTPMPDLPAARAGGGLVTLGRELHFFSGNDAARGDVVDHYVLNLDNPAAGWTARAALPTARSHMGYAAFAGQIYAIGGQTGNDASLTTVALVHAYDPATDQWTARASMTEAISHISGSTFVLGNRILVAGGETAHEKPTASVLAFDPAANKWTRLESLPEPRFSGVAAAIEDVIFFAGGSADQAVYRGTPLL